MKTLSEKEILEKVKVFNLLFQRLGRAIVVFNHENQEHVWLTRSGTGFILWRVGYNDDAVEKDDSIFRILFCDDEILKEKRRMEAFLF